MSQILQELPERPLVVFSTAYSQFAVDAFNLEAFDYLLKPVKERVLAARLKGISEIVTEGTEGCLFDPGNKDEFLGKLARLKADPALRARMGEAGRRRAVAEFDPATITENTVKTLRSFLR